MRRTSLELLLIVATAALLVFVGCPEGEVGVHAQQGSIEGQVTMELADDYSGVEVSVDDETTHTDSEGNYRLDFLSAGDVDVRAQHPGYATEVETIHVEAEETTTLDFELELDDAEPAIHDIDVDPGVMLPEETADVTVQLDNPDEMDLHYDFETTHGFEITDTDGPEATLAPPDAFGVDGQLTVEIEDPREMTDEMTVAVSTRDNAAPEITHLSADPPQTQPGGEIELAVEAEDPDGDDIDIEWTVSDDWQLSSQTDPEVTLTAPDEYGNTADVELTVTDEFGATTTAEVIVSTLTNQGPWLTKLDADPMIVERAGTIELLAEATHPEDEPLQFDWSAPEDWQLDEDDDEPGQPELIAPDAPAETAQIEVTVTDPDDHQAVGSLFVSTPGNTPPVIASLQAEPPAVAPGETTSITAEAFDPDGLDLTYSWDIPSGWSGSSSTDAINLQAPGAYDQTATVILTVDDGYDTTSASVAVSTLPPVEPIITNFIADPPVVERNGQSLLNVEAEHPYEDTNLQYHWSGLDPGWSLSSAGDTATLTAPDVPGDETGVDVTVEDTAGNTADASLVVAVDQNQPPTIQGFDLDSDAPYNQWIPRDGSGQITAHVDQGDDDDLDYDWTITGEGDWSLNNQNLVPYDDVVADAPELNNVPATVILEVNDDWGGTDVAEFDVRTQDTIPTPFGFEDRDQVDFSTQITSNEVVLQNFDGPLVADCNGCSLSINGASFSSSAEVWPGDSIRIRVTSSDSVQETVTADVTVGETTSDLWEVTTYGLIGDGTEDDPYHTLPLLPSCWQYQQEFPDQVEDGIYRLEVGGVERRTWCDTERHGGGWTMVLQAPNEEPRNDTWCQPDAYDPPSDPEPKEQTFKFDEDTINDIRSAGNEGIYRFTGVENTYHFFQSHDYDHQRDVDDYAPARQYWTSPDLSGSPVGEGGGHHSVEGLASGHWSPYTASHKHNGCFVDAEGDAGDSWGVLWVR